MFTGRALASFLGQATGPDLQKNLHLSPFKLQTPRGSVTSAGLGKSNLLNCHFLSSHLNLDLLFGKKVVFSLKMGPRLKFSFPNRAGPDFKFRPGSNSS